MRTLMVALLLLAAPAMAATQEDFAHTTPDGTVLDASRWVPEGDGPWPGVLITNGWGDVHDAGDELTWAERYADQGYLVYGYTSRGWGDSEGQVELNGPLEVADARSVIDRIAEDPDAVLDGPGDPRIGMVGKSYGGGIQFLVAREDPRLDVLVPTDTWSDLLEALGPDGVMKQTWVRLLLASGYAGGHGIPLGAEVPDPDPEGPSPKLAEWYTTYEAHNGPTEEIEYEMGEVRSLHAGELRVPTLLVQGWPDTLFSARDALRTYGFLLDAGLEPGREARLVLWQGGHGGFPHAGNATVDAHVDDFLAVHLKDAWPQVPTYPVVRHRYDQDDFVGETQWPPTGSTPLELHLDDLALSPSPPAEDAPNRALFVTGIDTTCVEFSQFQSQQGAACPRRDVQATAARWATEPFGAPVELTGTPELSFTVFSRDPRTETFLFAYLVDIGPDGEETPVLSQTTPMRLGDLQEPARVDVLLEPVTHRFAAGHRLGLVLASDVVGFADNRGPGQLSIISNQEQPSTLTVAVVPEDAWGDRMGPWAELEMPGHTCADVCRSTAGSGDWEVRTSDLTGIATVRLLWDGAALEVLDREREDGQEVWRFAPPQVVGEHTLDLFVEDLAGNVLERQLRFAPDTPPVVVEECPDGCLDEGTPLPLLVVVAALGLALVGRWKRRA